MAQTKAQLLAGKSDQSVTFNDVTASSLNGGPFGGRNRLINGGFDIWQRGTSQSTSGYGSADRWNLNVSGTCTFSQETSVVPSGAQYALKWTTGAASSYGQARQFIEQLNVIPLRGQTLTASAYVRSGGGFTGNIIFEIGYSTSTDASSGSFTVISTTTSGTINSSSYTQIKTTFTVPSNAVGLYVGIVPDAVQGNGATVYQSLVQLEPGSVATPFERRSYGQELALCQRYYFRCSAMPIGMAVGSNQPYSSIKLPVTMRSSPSLDSSGNSWAVSTGSAGTVGLRSGAGYGPSPDAVAMYNVSNNWTANTDLTLSAGFSAEL